LPTGGCCAKRKKEKKKVAFIELTKVQVRLQTFWLVGELLTLELLGFLHEVKNEFTMWTPLPPACLSVTKFQRLNLLSDFHETWYSGSLQTIEQA